MKITTRTFTLAVCFIIINSIKSYGQNYFIVNKDTTFCTNLSYETTMQGFLKRITYTDINGNNVDIQGRKNVPDVETFCISNEFFDKTPLKPHKPKKYIRYTKRSVDGKLKIYVEQPKYVYDPKEADGQRLVSGYRFILKLPDGKFVKINKKKNIERIIKPYMLQCEAFKEKYTGTFDYTEAAFIETVKLYNSMCK